MCHRDTSERTIPHIVCSPPGKRGIAYPQNMKHSLIGLAMTIITVQVYAKLFTWL